MKRLALLLLVLLLTLAAAVSRYMPASLWSGSTRILRTIGHMSIVVL